jgi:hypothetical protein
MKKLIIFTSTLALFSCHKDSDKINSVKNELNKIYTDKNMVENLEYQTGNIKDKDAYNILYNYFENDYVDGLKEGVDISESKEYADKFKKLEYEAKGQVEFTKVNFLRVIEKDTLMDGTYYFKGNIIVGNITRKSK